MSSNSDSLGDAIDYEKSEKSESSSRDIKSKSSSSFKKRIQKLQQEINVKKSRKEPVGRDTRTLEVLKFKKRLADEQKDYIISIDKNPKSEELYADLVKMDDIVDKYASEYIEGTIGKSEYEIKATQSLNDLKDFLGSLERHISIDDVAKKLLGVKSKPAAIKKLKGIRTRKSGKPLIKGVEIPPLVFPAVPRIPTSPLKYSSSDSLRDKPKKPVDLTRVNFRDEEKPFETKIRKKGIPPSDRKIISKLVESKKSKRKFETAGLIAPVKNIDQLSDKELEKLMEIEGLSMPKIEDPKIQIFEARKKLKKYYDEQKPKREFITNKSTDKLPKVLTGDFMKFKKRPIITDDPIITARIKKKIRKPVKLTKKIKKIKKPPKRAPIKTMEVFDPTRGEVAQLKWVKGKGLIPVKKSPLIPKAAVQIQTAKKVFVYDPNEIESWTWEPDEPKLKNEFNVFKNKILQEISWQTDNNLFTLAHSITWAHEALQQKRKEYLKLTDEKMKYISPKQIKARQEYMKQNQNFIENLLKKRKQFKSTVAASPVSIKRDILIPIQGQIRPGGKTTGGRIIHRVPVSVQKYKIPPHYSRVDVLEIKGLAAKGFKMPEKQKYVISRTPIWEKITPTGEITKENNTTYKNITEADLQKYLGQTYLLGYNNTSPFHKGAPISVSLENRTYAYQRAVDLRVIRGTMKRGGSSPPAPEKYEILKSDIDREISRGKHVMSYLEGSKDTAKIKMERKLKEIDENIQRIMEIANYNPKEHGDDNRAVITDEQWREIVLGKRKMKGVLTIEQKENNYKQVEGYLKILISYKSSFAKNKVVMSKLNHIISETNKWLLAEQKGQTKIITATKRKGTKDVKKRPLFLRIKKSKSSSASSSTPASSSSSSSKTPTSSPSAKKSSSQKDKSPTPPPTPPPKKPKVEETLAEMIERLQKEKKAGILKKTQAPKPMNVSKPVQKAYPGITMEDLFGSDFDDTP